MMVFMNGASVSLAGESEVKYDVSLCCILTMANDCEKVLMSEALAMKQ